MRFMERETGVEPATPTLARWCSTTELFPQNSMFLPLLLAVLIFYSIVIMFLVKLRAQ